MATRTETMERRNPSHAEHELSPEAYYAGLKPIDRLRVKTIVGLIQSLNPISDVQYTVLAIGSTTRPEDRANAHDIDLKVLSAAESLQERKRAINWIKDRIRGYLIGSSETYREADQTFKWGGDVRWDKSTWGKTEHYDDPEYQIGDYLVPNEDPSFVVSPIRVRTEETLPLHISIAGQERKPTDDWLANERERGGSFAVLTPTVTLA